MTQASLNQIILDLMKSIEPIADEYWASSANATMTDVMIMSIAVSLRRMADRLDKEGTS